MLYNISENEELDKYLMSKCSHRTKDGLWQQGVENISSQGRGSFRKLKEIVP
jgi:hypothetical protein